MPPKKQTKNGEEADTGGTILSDVEIQLLAAVCTHAPKNIWTANWSVDWQKVTDTLGATNIRATKERFRSSMS